MQITEELKEKLANAKTEDERSAILAEAKEIAQKAGIELEDAELDEAAGGIRIKPRHLNPHTGSIVHFICSRLGCRKTYSSMPSGGKCVCGSDLITA